MTEHGILENNVLIEYSEIFKQMGHPSRLCILVNLMACKESNVSNMQNCLCEPQSTVSQHLGKLKSAGLITGERNGTEIIYKVSNNHVRGIIKDLLIQLGKGECLI
ncbi:MAG: Transcriptional regulator, ArsR family [Clostridiales bacterium 38_11]|nr:MAG: Transcriptional regulator, ArsR family [Clostridiales bacterium 38_11]HBH12793.1 transcriptional regulator [Clostridiales bacterium]